MRERVSVLEVEETANVVFAFSEEAGSGEPNPGLRPRKRNMQITRRVLLNCLLMMLKICYVQMIVQL